MKNKILFVLAFILPLSLLAKDYPMMQSQEIVIPAKKRTTFALPFKIQEVRKGVFFLLQEKKVVKDEKKPTVPKLTAEPKKLPTQKEVQNDVVKTGPSIIKGVDNIELFPRYEGEMEITLWGYDKYPMTLKVKIVNDDTLENYFVFKDYEANEKKLTSGSHIEAIAQMLYPMYEFHDVEKVGKKTNGCLKGHRLVFPQWSFVTNNNLKLESVFECNGKRYSASKWIMTNMNNHPISIGEIEDYRNLKQNMKAYFSDIDRGIYSISFEDAEQKILYPNEKVQTYVVAEVIQKRQVEK